MIRRAAALAVFGLVILDPPSRATAQDLSARVGGLHARYSDSIAGNAGALGMRLALSSPRALGIAEASWAQFSGGEGAGQAWADVSLIGASSRSVVIGVRGTGIANGSSSGTWSTIGTGEVFGLLALRALTLSLGVSGGGVRSFTLGRRPVGGAMARARIDVAATLSLSAGVAGTVSGGIQYADATLTVDWRRGGSSAGALAGRRSGDLAGATWVQAWASMALTPAVSFEASAGSYPRDLTGYDHGEYFHAGLRVRLTSAARSELAAAPSVVARRATGPEAVRIERLDSTRTRVTFRVLGVNALGVAGEWNAWTPQPLTGTGTGRWTVVIPVGSGAHRFALVTGDGGWIVPDGVTKLPDDFGGEVGLLVIP